MTALSCLQNTQLYSNGNHSAPGLTGAWKEPNENRSMTDRLIVLSSDIEIGADEITWYFISEYYVANHLKTDKTRAPAERSREIVLTS